ncbi:hypothetical protein ACFW9N_19775 [Streptomyces sp. NPDC059496]|uniref:hypothetical protein n=1 Tax=Streptomyces sp. NPDC059496 TaxID=3346851 RepID=UPI0036A093FE
MNESEAVPGDIGEELLALVEAGHRTGRSKLFGNIPGLCIVPMSRLLQLAGHHRASPRAVADVESRLAAVEELGHFPARLPSLGRADVCLYRRDFPLGQVIEAVLRAPEAVDGDTAVDLSILAASVPQPGGIMALGMSSY